MSNRTLTYFNMAFKNIDGRPDPLAAKEVIAILKGYGLEVEDDGSDGSISLDEQNFPAETPYELLQSVCESPSVVDFSATINIDTESYQDTDAVFGHYICVTKENYLNIYCFVENGTHKNCLGSDHAAWYIDNNPGYVTYDFFNSKIHWVNADFTKAKVGVLRNKESKEEFLIPLMYGKFENSGEYEKQDDHRNVTYEDDGKTYVCVGHDKTSPLNPPETFNLNFDETSKRYTIEGDWFNKFIDANTFNICNTKKENWEFVEVKEVPLTYMECKHGSQGIMPNNGFELYPENEIPKKNETDDTKTTDIKTIDSLLDFINIPDSKIQMLKTPVTQKLFKEVMGSNPSFFQPGSEKYVTDRFFGTGKEYKITEGENPDLLPVEYVSWLDAIYFCNKLSQLKGLEPVYSIDGITDISKWSYVPLTKADLPKAREGNPDNVEKIEQNLNANGYRLPMQTEWTFAAKGGEDFIYSGSNNIDETTWYKNNSNGMTHEVAKKKANNYGLYDMCGNVAEWCWEPASPDRPLCLYNKSCNGGFSSISDDCKINYIKSRDRWSQNRNVGFRIVCNKNE